MEKEQNRRKKLTVESIDKAKKEFDRMKKRHYQDHMKENKEINFGDKIESEYRKNYL